MKNIANALVKAQKDFGPALKTSSNPHFRTKYADLSACVEAVMDSLNANGIALIQQMHECQDGVICETVFLHESGEFYSAGKLHVPAAKQDPQGYGSALTYARRYSLMAACGIAPEDDDGNASKIKPAISNPVDSKAANQIADLMAAMETAVSHDELRKHYEQAYSLAAGDQATQAKIIDAKNKRKAQLAK
jgi:hypothetical protein